MLISYKIKAEELNYKIIEELRDKYKGKILEIMINVDEENDILKQSSINNAELLKRIINVENNNNLVSFSIDEFKKI